MPVLTSMVLPPPSSASEFEDLVMELLQRRFENARFRKIGRSGQRQHGIDGFDGNVKPRGIVWQATLQRHQLEKKLRSDLSRAVGSVFRPSRYVFVTAAPRDATLSSVAVELSTSACQVEIAFWEDLWVELTNAPSLFKKYYSVSLNRPTEPYVDPAPVFLLQDQAEVGLGPHLNYRIGDRNWFAYPDNPSAIGVTKLSKDFEVRLPISKVDNKYGRTPLGDRNPGDTGSQVELSCALRDEDVPPWQRSAIDEWRAQRRSAPGGISIGQLDRIFGNCNWVRHSVYEFAAHGTPTHEIEIRYPITSVDQNNQKYGVGMEPAKADIPTTIWVAGSVPDPRLRRCPPGD